MARSLGRFHDAERRLWTSFAMEVTERRVTLPRSGVVVRVQQTGSGFGGAASLVRTALTA